MKVSFPLWLSTSNILLLSYRIFVPGLCSESNPTRLVFCLVFVLVRNIVKVSFHLWLLTSNILLLSCRVFVPLSSEFSPAFCCISLSLLVLDTWQGQDGLNFRILTTNFCYSFRLLSSHFLTCDCFIFYILWGQCLWPCVLNLLSFCPCFRSFSSLSLSFVAFIAFGLVDCCEVSLLYLLSPVLLFIPFVFISEMAHEVQHNVKINRQTTLDTLYVYPPGVMVEYPATKANDRVGHLFEMDSGVEWHNPATSFAYSLGEPKGRRVGSKSGGRGALTCALLVDSQGSLVPICESHATCMSLYY